MSGTDRDALAGEYVLGTLDARQADAVAAALPTDPALAAAVAGWERNLAPLLLLAPPEAPPPNLWDRIEARIAPTPRTAPAENRATALWRIWALGATLAAAVFAAIAVIPRAPAPQMMTVLVAGANQAAWLASVTDTGAIKLAALPPPGAPATPIPAGRSMELWALPPGATAPTSLGVLPTQDTPITIPAPAIKPVPGMMIIISLEAQGGSPTGQPQGPVLFIGRLSQAGGPL